MTRMRNRSANALALALLGGLALAPLACGGSDSSADGAPSDGGGGGKADASPLPSDAKDPGVDANGGKLVDLPTKPGVYRATCDGSGGVALDGDHFLAASDEDQVLRVYRRGADGAPLGTVDVSTSAGVAATDEADIEDLVRVGNRVYGITSHGRTSKGELETPRYRFFGFDLASAAPNVTTTGAGFTDKLLPQMLQASSWVTPDAEVIARLGQAAKLADDKDSDLAPELDGLNIEGLTALPTAGRLAIGFRNPAVNEKAILVTLLNPDEVLMGKAARFGEAIRLDLGGLRVRAMAFSKVHDAVLVVGGAKDPGTTFRLFKWSGAAGAAPVAVKDITAPASTAPEAIVIYENTKDVQILFDEGDKTVKGAVCKDVASGDQSFTDVIVHVD